MINNRDLSWLTFNERVLQEAQDKTVPLMQRLRFLGIFSNNQDEFIKVRVANIVRLSQIKGKKAPLFSGGYTAQELLPLVNSEVIKVQKKFEQTYSVILSEMEEHGIYVINENQLNKTQKQFCHEYFSSVISPRLVPLILRKTTQIPFLRDNNIYHAIKMSSGKNNSHSRYAIIQIPVSSSCPRFIGLPSAKGRNDIIFLDDIIRLCLDEIFFMFNYNNISAYTFKLMRDALLTLDDDISKSLVEKMEVGLQNRLHGQPVRLVYDKDMPHDLLDIIASKLKLKEDESLDAGGRYHLMRDLMRFPKVRPNLESKTPEPLEHPDLEPFSSILKAISKKDILLSYPYHTFNHFINFLREAAIDPKVENIYITLYRTAERSKVINTLINAAKNGKKVIVLLELLARFDEEQNVEYSELLQKEGIKVIHGVNGLKVHSKLVLVERKNKKFAYVGTGNFNETTAKIYGDFGLFTSDPQIVADTSAVFDFLLNTHKHFSCKQLLVSPYYMRSQFESLIKQEIRNAQKGKKAYIYAKFNSLTDEEIINLLYSASQAGVEIRLIIRGACCLQPQVKGLSENIHVISIVDIYLEHARLAIFHNDGDEKVYIMSADWMNRNLDRRVEVGTPILDKKIKQSLKEVFNIQWADNEKARDLTVFGRNIYVEKGKNKPCRSQIELYDYYKKMK
ncbi:polyphosphate kinase 1 [Dysgonomonas sp. Marseille-P4677]|uniref:polyphosphate kinase 1 n=1 Tax=Dysgonomonas sp. Marseille-P4677 TaxID=2364790 RepID=UPI001913FD01|nr:polyphosphate kinase 1 [Dysgonomonas sp. Marseille-P4677]MBK5721583.1 polyphosphate kinase 1 [Dysgonomonas sp. Marseille-P4677]